MPNETLALTIYLTRHGQSCGGMTIDGRTLQHVPLAQRPPGCETGRMEDDWRLTPLGQRQAELLGQRLAAVPFDAIYCSPLERARATARAVEERQPGRVPTRVLHELLEVGDYGEESAEGIYARATRVAATLRNQAPGAKILVVAHGAFNHRLLVALLGVPPQPFRFDQSNTGLSIITYAGAEVPERKRTRLLCMNDLSHLPTEAQTII